MNRIVCGCVSSAVFFLSSSVFAGHPLGSSSVPDIQFSSVDANSIAPIAGAIVFQRARDAFEPKCFINTINRPSLVPPFAVAETEVEHAVADRSELGRLPACAPEIENAIAVQTDHMVLAGRQVAMNTFLIACAAGAAVGFISNSYWWSGGIGGVGSAVTAGLYDSRLKSGVRGLRFSSTTAAMSFGAGAALGAYCYFAADTIVQFVAKQKVLFSK